MSDTSLFSIKMRASEKDSHISGAEKIIKEEQLNTYVTSLLDRGLHHSKGNADFINLKVEKIDSSDITYLDALDVTTVEVDNYKEGLNEIVKYLEELNVKEPNRVLEFLKETYAMRGAMILDINTYERLEEDKTRGVRATYMDLDRSEITNYSLEKNHYLEAIVLATKVCNAPNIIGEICISDDPNYVTGYVSSKIHGYKRITKMKEMGSPNGGRIFLYNGDIKNLNETIDYLEKTKVIVHGIKQLMPNLSENPIDRLQEKLSFMKDNNLYRTMKTIETSQSSHIKINDKEYVLMASNSYLDITNHPYMISSCKKALDLYGVGSGGSRLTTGNTMLHEKLEEKIASFKNRESSIVFNTGYVANLATIQAIMKDGGIIFSDELNHASIIDGIRLSKAKCIVYKHNDMSDLKRKIIENPSPFKMVVSDAVFSMDGDILKLDEFVSICKEYNCLSMVDEAHSTGVIGKTGHGIEEYYDYKVKPDILMGTLSKAIGGEGGFVTGSKIIIDYLRNFARGFIFSTSLSMPTIASNIAGIEIIENNPSIVKNLQDNVKYFCKCLNDLGLNINSNTAIVPIIIGDEKKTLDISNKLMDSGYYISAIRYPTVKMGEARLRVAIMASHTYNELKTCAELIYKFMNE